MNSKDFQPLWAGSSFCPEVGYQLGWGQGLISGGPGPPTQGPETAAMGKRAFTLKKSGSHWGGVMGNRETAARHHCGFRKEGLGTH